MRAFNRVLVATLLNCVLSGCGESVEPLDAVSLPMPFGVIVDLSYAGDTAQLNAEAMVYVFLREQGQRMPLAVQHFEAAQLPKRISFTTADPRTNVELVARLSNSGRVEQAPGDLQVSRWIATVGHPPQTVDVRLGETLSSEDSPVKPAAPPVTVPVLVSVDRANDFPPDSVVFVVARQEGNRMPLAVRKLALGDLPVEIVLSDADAMMFSHRLSSVDSFTLIARISQSGAVDRSVGDLESEPVTVHAGAVPERVMLNISGFGQASSPQ